MTLENINIKLIKKLHAGMDNTCFSAILTDWKSSKMKQEEVAEDLFDLICDGLSKEDAGRALGLDLEQTDKLLQEYQCRYCNTYKTTLYDRLFTPNEFYKQCDDFIATKQKEVYFSINSYYRRKRLNADVRHLNAFVLDFDYYKISEYADMEAGVFYKKVLKKQLIKEPTAVIDSGRGLYLIYAFKHCSYHMDNLYHAILNDFFKKFEKYGMDPAAMLTSQVIRIPGTMNSKTNRIVEILEFHDTNYKIQDFAEDLPWSLDAVKEYRKEKISNKKEKKQQSDEKDLSRRKPYFQQYYDDFKQLIMIRNKSDKYKAEGYREQLIYLMREKACWMGYTVDESVKMAFELNKMFNVPLMREEVEKQCKPSDNRMPCSIDTIINKLSMTIEEQMQMKVLKRRHIKKSLYAKRKRMLPMLNRTKKQQNVLERRTRVCELKNIKHLKNAEIADILLVDKATVTRDLQYIKKNPSKFIRKLSDYIHSLDTYKFSEEFTRKTVYIRQKHIVEWLKIAKTALDYMVREMGVAKN